MAALFLLLAIAGTAVVADLVLESTGAGAITVLHHPISGYRDGLVLAMAAALGLVIGLLMVGSVSMRRTRRARRRQLRRAERELSSQLLRLERENTRLRDELVRRDSAPRRLVGSPRPPISNHPRPRARFHHRWPTARSSQSMKRPGGSLASATAPSCRFPPPTDDQLTA